MPAYKDEAKGTWFAAFYFKDWQGKQTKKMKRGFATKKEALAWERDFLQQKTADLNMNFGSFVEIYCSDMRNRLKRNTWLTKESIIDQKILPYFKDKRMNDIKTTDVIQWQNVMINYRNENGEPYSPVYLKTLHNQLSALMDKPISYYAFQMLYWCGLRLGELLALTPADFDFKNRTVKVSKSYQRIQMEDVVTSPKTEKSNRIITMPAFLCAEMSEYIQSIYEIQDDQRIFPISKSYLHHEMDRGTKVTGVKRIKIHGLRHSHISLLIDMGFSAVAIADRVGHESIDITYRYAHLFPSKQQEIANKLTMEDE